MTKWKLNGLYSKVLSDDELELEICTIGINENNDHFGYEQYKANAKLCAAAPELLKACEWAIKQFEILADKGLYPEHMLHNNGGVGYMPIIEAIKKATL